MCSSGEASFVVGPVVNSGSDLPARHLVFGVAITSALLLYLYLRGMSYFTANQFEQAIGHILDHRPL